MCQIHKATYKHRSAIHDEKFIYTYTPSITRNYKELVAFCGKFRHNGDKKTKLCAFDMLPREKARSLQGEFEAVDAIGPLRVQPDINVRINDCAT